MARIDPSGLDIAADEQYAPVGALQVNFTGMKRQMQLLAQKIADHGNQRFQITGILVHDIKIIHITAVMTHFQLPFHPLVEAIHVDIAEQLRSQIARWEDRSRAQREKDFCSEGNRPTPFAIRARCSFASHRGKSPVRADRTAAPNRACNVRPAARRNMPSNDVRDNCAAWRRGSCGR